VPRDTREELLKAGLELLLEGGYDHAGTSAILERADVPRGSFYHHFEDKKSFALAVAQYYYERHLPVLDELLSDERFRPLERLRRYFEGLRDYYQQRAWREGCLLGMLGQELADRDETSREVLTRLFSRWRHRLATCLREAQADGTLSRETDCDELAGFLIDSWEGALIQMKVRKSGTPLDAFIHVTFERLLASR
jgi:TetR/AcrR family transcriptional repressor of nem operon